VRVTLTPGRLDLDKTIETRDGLALQLREWTLSGAKGTIVVVHGLGEHVGRYAHVAAFFNAQGWRVVGFDQRGHGKSGGGRGRLGAADDLLADLGRVIDRVRAEHPGPLLLLGHSLGGLVAARFVAETVDSNPVAAAWARPIDALILSSPVLDTVMTPVQKLLLAVLAPLAPNLAIGNGIDPAGISRDPAVVAAYRADPLVHDRIAPRLVRFIVDAGAFVRRLAPRWNVPTLLVYSGSDRLVASSGSAAFASAAPKGVVTARVFSTLFHEVFNEPERAEVFATVAGWLDTLPLSLFRSPR
jgi:alpha-beta hydrolase superfamily lysophospholipase